MSVVPQAILALLQQHQVLSMSVSVDDMPWSASAFFTYDDECRRLILLSSLETRHGEILSINPRVAGTVAAQFENIDEIHGLQFYGIARLLNEPQESEHALRLYHQRFPQVIGMYAPTWEIRLQRLKLTDNRLGFGTKIQWHRDSDGS
jgi:uncharacterized protein YhbP (UPF0306 family)